MLHRIAHWFGLGWSDKDADWFHVYDEGTHKVCIRCGRVRRQ
jgi:hypothetical protein